MRDNSFLSLFLHLCKQNNEIISKNILDTINYPPKNLTSANWLE